MAIGPINPEQLARLYPSVGAIIVYWGLIDTTITHIALVMFRVLKLQDAHHALPTMFGNRLEILKTNFKKREELAPYKDKVLQAIRAINEMQTLRDMLVHGVAAGYDPTDDAIVFSRIDRLTPGQKRQARSPLTSHQFNRMPVTFKTLDEASDRGIAINTFLNGLLGELEALAP